MVCAERAREESRKTRLPGLIRPLAAGAVSASMPGDSRSRVFDVSLEVEGLVDQAVGVGVLLAGYVGEGTLVELAAERAGLLVQRLEYQAPDAVDALHLPDQQLRVAANGDMRRPEPPGGGQGGDQPIELGCVAGGPAEEDARFVQDGPVVGCGYHHTGGGRSGVPARTAVNMDNDRELGLAHA